MGREGENLPLARASRPSVADALQGVGRHAWRITRAVDCRSGTKGQSPLVFPRRKLSRHTRRDDCQVAIGDRLSADAPIDQKDAVHPIGREGAG